MLERIRAAGIGGLGGAGFPTAAKLAARPADKIHTLVVNGAECEPYISADDLLMRERATQVLGGIDILVQILCPEEVLVGIEDDKPEAIAALGAALGERPYRIVALPTRYPSGGERQLIQLLTGRKSRRTACRRTSASCARTSAPWPPCTMPSSSVGR